MSDHHFTVGVAIAAVSAVTGVSHAEIIDVDHYIHPEVVRARLAAIWVASKLVPLDSIELARAFDRDQAFILAVVARAEDLRAADRDFRIDTDGTLGAVAAIKRNGLMRLKQPVDPLATARRVLAHPARESVRVSSHEIIALCQVALAALGDDPTEPDPSEPNQEIEHAA